MKQYLTIGFFLLLAGMVTAQNAKLKRANKAFEEFNYQEAIILYNQILNKSDVSEAKINLAESYRKVSNTEEAEYWYGQIVNLPESLPVHKLYYGMMLQTNGKCDLAKEWYMNYVQDVPDDLRGRYLVKACDYEDELMTKNAGVYEIENMPFNTSLDDFSPAMYKEGIVYASEYQKGATPIKREHTWTGNPFLELYFVDRITVDETLFDYEYGDAEKFSNRLNSKFHDAAVSFTEDFNEIYFTRNNFVQGRAGRDDEGAIRLKIYSARNEGGGSVWTGLESMPFNSDEYSVAHPALTSDGQTLYFASDMPGGFGGMDLYVSQKENERWGPPINLGPGINTEGHEVFPFVAKSNQLFFSSDGHIGLGGLDIYQMEMKKDGSFGEIINIGYPINQSTDDFGIIMNEEGTHGYFSSDREGGKGDDDIYSFIKTAAPVEIFVYDEETGIGIPNAVVVNDCTGNTLQTDEQGFARIEQKLNQCCMFDAMSEGYLPNKKEGCTNNIAAGERLLVEIPLRKEAPAIQHEISGIIYDETTRRPINGATVELIPVGCESKETIYFMTQADGFYQFDLENDCCYEIRASKTPDYLATRSKQQCTKGLAKSTSIRQDLYLMPSVPTSPQIVTTTPGTTTYPGTSHTTDMSTTHTSTFNQGRTDGTYLLHIYYDFDQSYIRGDAEPELNKLLAIMQENTEYVVEIGSHTDSRGSHKYNDRLSQRRAESVVRWLKEKGISSSRVRPRGYGEDVNVNNCSNNIPCSEEEHQWNRRTEFKILGYYDSDGNYQELVKSEKPGYVKIDRCEGCPF